MMLIFSLMLGAVCAADVDDFLAPDSLHKVSNGTFADGQGRALSISEDIPKNHQAWFENDTGYIVQPFDVDDRYYMFFESSGELGILEVVEHGGDKYIVNSWTKNGIDDCYGAIFNMFEFNDLNNLTPVYP